MRRVIVVAALLAAPSLFASAFYFNEQEVVVEVGQTDKSLRVRLMGGFGKDFGAPNQNLHSADSRIAFVLRFPDDHFEITGISPGDTEIIGTEVGNPNAPRPSHYVKIHVVCGNELPVRAEQAVIAARAGEAVQLRALSEIAPRTTFQWYAGRIGDTSQPLATGGATLTFTALTSPKQYVWVSAITACTSSAAEFEIDVPPSRGRAVRH